MRGLNKEIISGEFKVFILRQWDSKKRNRESVWKKYEQQKAENPLEPVHNKLLLGPLSWKTGMSEMVVMVDLLMKKGEARTFGVIKGDRERVTVGLRQKSCSIAGRNIKQWVHRKPMQPCLEGGFSVVWSRLYLFKLLTRPHLVPVVLERD